MATDNGGVVDAVEVALNPESDAPLGLGPDAKGPDPAQWPVHDRLAEDIYSDEPTVQRKEVVANPDHDPDDPASEPVVTVTVEAKGPDPAEWSDEARAARAQST